MLCATVCEPTTAQALASLSLAAPFADLLEIRLDALGYPDPAALIAGSPKPVIVTCRSPRDGGAFAGTEAERFALLHAGIDAGAAWVDIEAHAASAFGDAGPAKRIVSWHDLERTPSDLTRILDELASHEPDLAKLVPTARGPEDVIRLLRLLRETDLALVAHPMGRAGFPGRILAARFGSGIIYGAARRGGAAAPGQPWIRELTWDYRLDRDLGAAAVILLIGGNLNHSVSPAMHNRAYAEEGIDALYVPWATDDPFPVLAAFEELEVAGAAVTIPHKEVVAMKMQSVDDLVTRVGALNTVTVTPEGLRGSNTDVGALIAPLLGRADGLRGKRALVVGAGGAGRAAAHGLAAEGAKVTVVNRSRDRALRLAAEVGGDARLLRHVKPEEIDIIVNATSVGQWPEVDEAPVPDAFLRSGHTVLDVVYNPANTKLTRMAEAKGCPTVGGRGMLARQAAAQIEMWFGRSVPAESLEEIAALALARRHSLVLLGLRGSGKTTVGRIVAGRTRTRFVDMDEMVEGWVGQSIPMIFAEGGEARFRTLEAEAAVRVLDGPGPVVVALGAGAVETPEVRAAIRKSAYPVVLLEASLEILIERIRGSDRPPLTALPLEEEAEHLKRRRDPLYRGLADYVIPADGTPETVAEAVDRARHGNPGIA